MPLPRKTLQTEIEWDVSDLSGLIPFYLNFECTAFSAGEWSQEVFQAYHDDESEPSYAEDMPYWDPGSWTSWVRCLPSPTKTLSGVTVRVSHPYEAVTVGTNQSAIITMGSFAMEFLT